LEKIEIKSFRDLIVWQKSVSLVTDIYQVTSQFPKEEIYGITSQIRRSAVSIPSNIAEGYGRKSTQDYIRFLQVAVGSLYELETQMEISINLEYLKRETYTELNGKFTEIEKMLVSMINKIDSRQKA
jgi:four helix bundle protein